MLAVGQQCVSMVTSRSRSEIMFFMVCLCSVREAFCAQLMMD